MIKKQFCECAWCGWMWTTRKGEVPKRCPNQKCKTMRWQKAVAVGESFLKYPVDHIGFGGVVYFPFSRDQKANSNRVAAINAWAKRHGREFYIDTVIREKQYHHRVKRVS